MTASGVLRALITLCLAAAVTAGCDSLPSLENRTVSTAFADTSETRLGKAVAAAVAANPGKSGIHSLQDARDAFAARMLLARAAERSLDVQYYIWKNDLSGKLLFGELAEAADRGVRVRLLLDDNPTSGLDETLAALEAHPNIEVRLFNPFVAMTRKWRVLGFLTDFSRLNRRMHNKSFTADNQVTVVGGRNVGDEYFGATDGVVFSDLDVLAIGPVVKDVSQQFDQYWASDSAYPVDRLLPRVPPEQAGLVESAAALVERDPAAAAYVEAVRQSEFVQELIGQRLKFDWASTRMVTDDPGKGLGLASEHELIGTHLKEAIGDPVTDVALVSPYFVPGEVGTDLFVSMAKRRVRVRVLTNSLEATDVVPVHAGYAKRRKPLLEAGVQLYELRSLVPQGAHHERDYRLHLGSGGSGSSASSLHAKTFAVDHARVFVGSFNFDPRSVHLNTELGFVIESPDMARRIEAAFDTRIVLAAYEVRMSDAAELVWIERDGAHNQTRTIEPGTTAWDRGLINFLSVLPIDWLL
jgi:putative cardiolipin synthase